MNQQKQDYLKRLRSAIAREENGSFGWWFIRELKNGKTIIYVAKENMKKAFRSLGEFGKDKFFESKLTIDQIQQVVQKKHWNLSNIQDIRSYLRWLSKNAIITPALTKKELYIYYVSAIKVAVGDGIQKITKGTHARDALRSILGEPKNA